MEFSFNECIFVEMDSQLVSSAPHPPTKNIKYVCGTTCNMLRQERFFNRQDVFTVLHISSYSLLEMVFPQPSCEIALTFFFEVSSTNSQIKITATACSSNECHLCISRTRSLILCCFLMKAISNYMVQFVYTSCCFHSVRIKIGF